MGSLLAHEAIPHPHALPKVAKLPGQTLLRHGLRGRPELFRSTPEGLLQRLFDVIHQAVVAPGLCVGQQLPQGAVGIRLSEAVAQGFLLPTPGSEVDTDECRHIPCRDTLRMDGKPIRRGVVGDPIRRCKRDHLFTGYRLQRHSPVVSVVFGYGLLQHIGILLWEGRAHDYFDRGLFPDFRSVGSDLLSGIAGCQIETDFERQRPRRHQDFRATLRGFHVVPDSDPHECSPGSWLDSQQRFMPVALVAQDSFAAFVPRPRIIEAFVDVDQQPFRSGNPCQRQGSRPELPIPERVCNPHPGHARCRIRFQLEWRQVRQHTISHAGTPVELDRKPEFARRDFNPDPVSRGVDRQSTSAELLQGVRCDFP